MLSHSLRLVVCMLLNGVAVGAEEPGSLSWDALNDVFGNVPDKFREYSVVLEPEQDAADWWAGAPSVARDQAGVFWLACRMRTAEAAVGLRGYELRILRSEDGIRFEHIKTIRREEVPVPGFERPALVPDPVTGRLKMYGCAPWPMAEDPWCILKWDDVESLEQLDPATARTVIRPLDRAYERDVTPYMYKDPVILFAEGQYHAYVIGRTRDTERTYHFVSPDGDAWEPAGNPRDPVMDIGGWHNFFTRPSSVVPMGIGYLFVYEGSNARWYDPVYNMGLGLAWTFDLHTMQEITTAGPLAVSSTPSPRFHTWRYSSWLLIDREWWIYAEVARPNDSNEIRLFRIPF